MHLPKIVVKQANVEENIDLVAKYISPSFNKNNKSLPFLEYSYKLFPELIGKITDNMTYKEIRNLVAPIVIQKLEEHKKEIEAKIISLQESFNKINDDLLKALADVHETKWPDNCKEITCYIGYIQTCPRDVRSKVFYVNLFDSNEKILKTAIHEIGHFMFYEKWQEIFGPVKEIDLAPPSARWFLEEMIVDPLLNAERIQKIVPFKQKAYNVFYKFKINNKSIIDNLKELYHNSKDIEDYIKNAYVFVEDNIDEIRENCG